MKNLGKFTLALAMCAFLLASCGNTPHEHTYATEWKYDDTHHWKPATCSCEDAGKSEYGEHEWDEGEVTQEPTTTENGIKTYTCDVCRKTRKVSIEKLPTENGDNSENSTGDNGGSGGTGGSSTENGSNGNDSSGGTGAGTGEETGTGTGEETGTGTGEETGTGTGEETGTGAGDSGGTGGAQDVVTTITVPDKTETITGEKTIVFENNAIKVDVGDEIKFKLKVSGAGKYVQMGFQTDIDDTKGWNQIWKDGGIPDNSKFDCIVTATKKLDKIKFQCLFQKPVTEGDTSSSTIKIENIEIINLTKGGVDEDDKPIYVAPTGDKFTPADTSKQMALNMAMGWNLGNYLDSTNWEKKQNAGPGVETEWRGTGAPKVSQAMITTVHNAGFKSIRIPVSWHNHISNESDYTIDSEWMDRVKEVVDYAYNEDMCVIINVHHDNIAANDTVNLGYAVSKDSDLQTKSKAYLQSVWTQIATTFKDYDNKLVFEVLNEPRCVGEGNDGFDINQTSLTINEAHAIIKDYEETCINAIRGVAGNEGRYIVVPAYACSSDYNNCVSNFTMPSDATNATADRLIFSFHAYSPYEFAMGPNNTEFKDSYKNELDGMFSAIYNDNKFKNIGIIIGEASASNKGNLEDREKWFSYYFGTAYKKYGMPTFLWDNGVATVDGKDPDNEGRLWNGERHGYLDVNAFKDGADPNMEKWFFPTLIQKAREAIYSN